jgi:hypothetical protein
MKNNIVRRLGQTIFTLLIAGGLFISACSPAPSVEKEIENTPEPEPTTTLVVPTEIEEIIDEPIPVSDVSGWVVTIGCLECTLELFGGDYPGWYMADCPEQLWFPIEQTAVIELNLLDSETCIISPIDDFEIAIQDLSIDAMIVKFIQIEDGGWGCLIPYSDTAGIEVVCGFEVECGVNNDEIKVIIFGKTIRVYLKEENGGGSGAGQSDPPWDDSNPKPSG